MHHYPRLLFVRACLLLGVVGALAARSAGTPIRCSIVTPPSWVRNNNASYVVVETRADTAPVMQWTYWEIFDVLRPRARDTAGIPLPSRTVYGQGVTVIRAGGSANSVFAAANTRQALVLSWDTRPDCSTVPAHAALVLPINMAAFIETKPDTVSPTGVPVLETGLGTRIYIPELERRAYGRSWRRLWRRVDVLSIAEYESLYRAMPPDSLWESNPDRATEVLESWADDHPHLAKRQPARNMLVIARWLRYRRTHPDPPQNE